MLFGSAPLNQSKIEIGLRNNAMNNVNDTRLFDLNEELEEHSFGPVVQEQAQAPRMSFLKNKKQKTSDANFGPRETP